VGANQKFRVCHVVITNNTHVSRHNTGGKYRRKCTGRGGIRTVGKCRTDATVGRLCVASLLRVPQEGNRVLVYEIMYWYRDKRSHQLYSIQFRTLKSYKQSKFPRKITAGYYKGFFYKKKRKTPHLLRNDNIFVNEIPTERWIGQGGPTNWPARSPDFSCTCVRTSTVSQ
jgi:hypothetical protein